MLGRSYLLSRTPGSDRQTVMNLDLEKSCWAFMQNIRGTTAYWQDAGSDVFAMLRALSPPTWFVTLSANEAGWDDLAIVLSGREIPLAEQKEYLASRTKKDRQKAVRENPVSH
jgi:hypothetical protein